MSQFVFLYRLAPEATPPSPQEMQRRMGVWMAWMKDLEQKGHIANRGSPLTGEGAVVKDKDGGFNDGPYAETKDIVIGFTLIEAKDLEQARKLAAGCPILHGGGLVEVRPVREM